MVPDFAFGFLENGEGGVSPDLVPQEVGEAKRGAADQQGHSGKDSEEDCPRCA